jgi:hypothetical protein
MNATVIPVSANDLKMKIRKPCARAADLLDLYLLSH